HLVVPVKYRTSDRFALGMWIARQRARKARLSRQRVAALDSIAMVWDVPDEAWRIGLDAARRYWEERGDLLVRSDYVAPDGYVLGNWLSNQRQARRKGELHPDRVADLDA